MRHGTIRSGEESWSPRMREERWAADTLPELNIADFLWGSAICGSEELRLRHDRDGVMYRLLDVGFHDWTGRDHWMDPSTLAMWHSSAMSSRLLDRVHHTEDQVDQSFCSMWPQTD